MFEEYDAGTEKACPPVDAHLWAREEVACQIPAGVSAKPPVPYAEKLEPKSPKVELALPNIYEEVEGKGSNAKPKLEDKNKETIEAKESSLGKEHFKQAKSLESDQLFKNLEKNGFSKEELLAIKDNIKTLEERAKSHFGDRIPDRELAKVYKDLNRLLEAGDGALLPQQKRNALAQQILSQAAHPEVIIAGDSPSTDIFPSLERQMYYRNPSVVSKAVTDLVLSGEFKAGGNVARLSAEELRQFADRNENERSMDQQQSLASQLFQNIAKELAKPRTE